MHFVRPILSSAAVLIVALGVSSTLAQQPNGGMTSGGSPSAGQSASLPNEGSPGQAGSDTGLGRDGRRARLTKQANEGESDGSGSGRSFIA